MVAHTRNPEHSQRPRREHCSEFKAWLGYSEKLFGGGGEQTKPIDETITWHICIEGDKVINIYQNYKCTLLFFPAVGFQSSSLIDTHMKKTICSSLYSKT